MGETGLLALVGGAEWRPGASFDAELLARSGGSRVLVLPTAAAYERPEKAVAWASEWFAGLGAEVEPLMVLRRQEAFEKASCARAAAARFIYLGGGSPQHLQSVLAGTPLLDAIAGAWREGASLAGSSAGAMALCDPMLDPGGGGLGPGLGVVSKLAIVPHHEQARTLLRRTLELAGPEVVVAGVPEQTALLLDGERWRPAGAEVGRVALYKAGAEVGFEELPV